MEYVRGVDLFEYFHMNKRHVMSSPVRICRQIAVDVLTGLKAMHDGNCIHKDIKFENVVLEENPHLERNLSAMHGII